MDKQGQLKEQGGVMFSNLILLVIFLVVVSVSGLFAGLLYFNMGLMKTTLLTVNFQLPIQDNRTAIANNMTDFQDILEVVVYPILDLKDSLPYLTYFMVFGFIIALGITAYLSSRNTVFFVLHLLFTIVISYFCILISNTYIDLMGNTFLNSLMLPFTIYNKLMFYLPQVVFFTSILFGAISFINIIKPQSSSSIGNSSLQYGGDY